MVHVQMGLQEMLAGAMATTDEGADLDAATYWTMWAEEEDEEDPVPGILMTRRTASAYTRPRGAIEHLEQACAGWEHLAPRLTDGNVWFQGHVLALGDFLATWAVEVTVHHLDLDAAEGIPKPSPLGVGLARRTAEALGTTSSTVADDIDAVLVGFGRVPERGA